MRHEHIRIKKDNRLSSLCRADVCGPDNDGGVVMQKFNRDNYEPSSETQRQIVQAVRNMQRQVKWMDRQRAMREARNDDSAINR